MVVGPERRIFLPEGLLDRSEIPEYLNGEVPGEYGLSLTCLIAFRFPLFGLLRWPFFVNVQLRLRSSWAQQET